MTLADLTERLVRRPGVTDAAAIAVDGGTRWVIATRLDRASIRRELADLGVDLEEDALDIRLVLRVPRRPDGTVDGDALASVPGLDAARRASDRHPTAAVGLGPRVASGRTVRTPRAPRKSRSGHEEAASTVDAGPAILHGPPLPTPGVRTLKELLEVTARAHPDRGITHLREDDAERQTYPDLLTVATATGAALRARGVARREAVVAADSSTQAYFQLLWGAARAGAAIIPVGTPQQVVSGDASVERLRVALEASGARTVVARPDDVAALSAEFGPAIDVVTAHELASEGHGRPDPRDGPEPSDPAIYFLTSGSTGVPKLVEQTHRNLLSHAAASSAHRRQTVDSVSLNWMPVDHVGACVMHGIGDVFVGNEQLHGPTSDILGRPRRWLDWMSSYAVTHTWAPNFAFAMVLEHEADLRDGSWDLSALEFLLSGGEAVVARTSRRFLRLLGRHGLRPDALIPAYGMSEICSAVTYSRSFSLDTSTDDMTHVAVGPPIAGVSLRVVDDEGNVVVMGSEGALQVKGPVVTPGYLSREDANRESFTDDGWFRTGDLARLERGELLITGREKETLVVRGAKHPCRAVEAALEELDGIEPSNVAVTAVRSPGVDTDEALIVVGSREDDAKKRRHLTETAVDLLTRRFGIRPRALVFVEPEAVPRTSIGKIQRSELRRRFESGELDEAVKSFDALAGAETTENWFLAPTQSAAPPLLSTCHERSVAIVGRTSRAAEIAATVPNAALTVFLDGTTDWVLESPSVARSNGSPLGLERLLEHVAQASPPITAVLDIHAAPDAPVEATTWSLRLLQLVHALASGQRPIYCQLVRHPSAGSAAEIALLRVADAESPRVSTGSVLYDTAALQSVAAEVGARTPHHVELKDGQRLVNALRPVQVDAVPEEAPVLPVSNAGFVLVAGGLGGVGSAVAEAVAAETDAPVLIVGRTRLRTVTAGKATVAARSQRLDELRSVGRVTYVAASILDANALRRAVAFGQEFFGVPLAHVVHAAGARFEAPLVDLEPRTIASALPTWLDGTENLAAVAADHGAALTVMGLASEHLPGSGVGVYAAVGAAMRHRCDQLRGSLPALRLVEWSLWHEVGFNARHPAAELGRRVGFQPLSTRQALDSLRMVTSLPEPTVVVGLLPDNPNVAPLLTEGPIAVEAVHVLTTGEPAGPTLEGEVVQWQRGEVPRLSDGSLDVGALLNEVSTLAGTYQPTSASERAVVDAWTNTLGRPPRDGSETFFAAGGDSLKAAQMVANLAAATGSQLTVYQLFENPTVVAAATLVEQRPAQQKRSIKKLNRQAFQVNVGDDFSLNVSDELRAVLDKS